MSNLIQVRRGLEKDMPILTVGEPAFAVDTRTLYIGSPAGNVVLSRDLQSFINEYTNFLDEVQPLVDNMLLLQQDLAGVEGGGAAVVINNTLTSTSITEAASANTVRLAYNEAQSAKQSASDGKQVVASAITGKGVAASGTDTFATLASKITSIPTGSTGQLFATGTLPTGGGVINAGFPIKFLMSLNTVDNELVTLAPAPWNGFGVGNGYDYAQGRTTISWSGNTATLGGAHANDPIRWIALG